MQPELTEQLSRNLIFEGLTTEQIDSVLPCILHAVEEYGSQECICSKGEELESPGVVLDGVLLVCRESADGKHRKVAHIEKNGLLGEAAAFSSTGTASHRIIAEQDTRVVYLSREFFLAPCSKECDAKATHQQIMQNMLRLLSDKTVLLNQKIAYLSAPDLKTKIAMYLCELYETAGQSTFTMPLNRDKLADFFSVARPSLSRELVNLKNLGIISFYRSSVTILDPSALYELAGKGWEAL